MAAIGLLSVIIMFGMIGFLFWIVFKNGVIKKKLFNNRKTVKLLLILYAAVLLLAVPISGMIQDKRDVLVVDDAHYFHDGMSELHESIYNGRIDELDPDFIQDEWEYKYRGKELQIRLLEGDPEQWIAVERKSEDDDVIEGKYLSSTVMDGIDLTKEIEPMKVKLDGDSLLLYEKARVDLKFAKFQKEFVLTQFNGESWRGFDSSSSDTRVLYLKIPKNLKLVHSDDIFIDYIEE